LIHNIDQLRKLMFSHLSFIKRTKMSITAEGGLNMVWIPIQEGFYFYKNKRYSFIQIDRVQ